MIRVYKSEKGYELSKKNSTNNLSPCSAAAATVPGEKNRLHAEIWRLRRFIYGFKNLYRTYNKKGINTILVVTTHTKRYSYDSFLICFDSSPACS